MAILTQDMRRVVSEQRLGHLALFCLADLKIAAARRVLNPAASLERELEVLRLLAAELSTTEIVRELVITVGAVRNRLKSI